MLLPAVSLFALVGLVSSNVVGQQVTLGASDLTTVSDKWSWVDCGEATNPVKIKSIDVSPDPPVPGQEMTVTVNAVANELVEEGAYANVVVKLGRIKLLSKTFDLCEEGRNANTTVQCPVERGEYTVSSTVDLPKEIPKAKFNVNVDGYTVNDEDLVCLVLTVDFTKKPWELWGIL
ncbi:ML domain-containing protein [Mycena floridula]|nr:ML domain-containing protein [Mycena floridula]